MKKKESRQRRARKTRARIRLQGVNRLCIPRPPRHIYAQVIAPNGSEVLASASTLDKEIRASVKYSGNVAAAVEVGKLIAQRAIKAGIANLAFDRSGFKYHGRVKALADAARENGLSI